MANEQYAFIQKDKVPSLEQWQKAVDGAGFDLQIYPELQIFEHAGFLPCKLMGKDSGVEVYYSPANEIFGDSAEDLAGNRDYCISFSWGGDFREAACAMILSYALASSFGAVVSYEGEEPQDLAGLRKGTEEILKEAAKAR